MCVYIYMRVCVCVCVCVCVLLNSHLGVPKRDECVGPSHCEVLAGRVEFNAVAVGRVAYQRGGGLGLPRLEHVRVPVHKRTIKKEIHTYTYMYIYTHMHTYVYILGYKLTPVAYQRGGGLGLPRLQHVGVPAHERTIYTYIYMYICIYTYMYTYIYTHTHIYIYI